MKIEKFKICNRCVLPENFPGITINSTSGICSLCDSAATFEEAALQRKLVRKKMEDRFDEVRGKYDYDCLVAYSGGKDSSYTLWLLAEHYKLRCLAITIDNGFIAEGAIENCKILTDNLSVDHIFFKPAFGFMKNLYLKSIEGGMHVEAAITRASSVCNSCITLINTHMLKTAKRQNIPIVAGGYLGGQLPKDSAMMEINLNVLANFRNTSDNVYVSRLGNEAKRFFSLETDRTSNRITVMNPLLLLDVSEEDIVGKLEGLGWKRPLNTGKHSSNCRLNDLGIHLHDKRHGFHPYLAELAEQVRRGLMLREQALERIQTKIDINDLSDVIRKLTLPQHEL